MQSFVWLFGVVLSLTASLFGIVGKILMKLSHNRDESCFIFCMGILSIVLLNPALDALSYAFAAQVLLCVCVCVCVCFAFL